MTAVVSEMSRFFHMRKSFSCVIGYFWAKVTDSAHNVALDAVTVTCTTFKSRRGQAPELLSHSGLTYSIAAGEGGWKYTRPFELLTEGFLCELRSV